jgi:hypothetical protein
MLGLSFSDVKQFEKISFVGQSFLIYREMAANIRFSRRPPRRESVAIAPRSRHLPQATKLNVAHPEQRSIRKAPRRRYLALKSLKSRFLFSCARNCDGQPNFFIAIVNIILNL